MDKPTDNRPTRLELENFMAFERAQFDFGRDLNVFVGENGTGKTQVMKAVFATLDVLSDPPPGLPNPPRFLDFLLRQKVAGVFRPGASVAQLVRLGADTARVALSCSAGEGVLGWTLSAGSDDLAVEKVPAAFTPGPQPVFIPPVELLSIFPGFISLYRLRNVEFDATWYDTAVLFSHPTLRQLDPALAEQLGLLEGMIGGKVELDASGRFQLVLPSGKHREMPLVAEGLRKLGTIARLIATGAFGTGTSLFWDEPESNLNPKLIKEVAKVIMALCRHGVQVFIATHSLFLLRELYILQQTENRELDARFFGLRIGDGAGGVEVTQGPTVDDIGTIAALDEDLVQSDRYLAVEYQAARGDE